MLRVFGAQVGLDVQPYPTARIWAPWNLVLEDGCGIGPHTIIYNVAVITLKRRATISQYSHLCSASHDYNSPDFALISAPILVEEDAWIAADAFISMGVVIGRGAVVGARASVYHKVAPWTVVGGNPAKVVGVRKEQQ